MNDRRQTMTY